MCLALRASVAYCHLSWQDKAVNIGKSWHQYSQSFMGFWDNHKYLLSRLCPYVFEYSMLLYLCVFAHVYRVNMYIYVYSSIIVYIYIYIYYIYIYTYKYVERERDTIWHNEHVGLSQFTCQESGDALADFLHRANRLTAGGSAWPNSVLKCVQYILMVFKDVVQ